MTKPGDTTIHIVGAGPAGLSAALAARRYGAQVVVHEKRHDVGGRFHDDFQGLENWSQNQDVIADLDRYGIASNFEHVPIRELVCFDAAGTDHCLRSTRPIFYLVRRGASPGALDHGLKVQAVAAGIRIRFDDRRTHLDGAGIVAEGPHRSDVIAAGYVFETEMPNGCYAAISDRLAPAGYSYLLVQGGHGTVAACLFRDFHRERIYVEDTVQFFRDHVGLKWQTARRFGGAGNFGRVGATTKGPCLYAGEAAGFQDALFGFGLRYALISGHLAGRALANDCASEFARACRALLVPPNEAAVANRWLYRHLGASGRQFVLARLVARRDPRRVLGRLYRPARWKRVLAQLVPAPPTLSADAPASGCDCTWCRCHRESIAIEGTQ